MTAFSDQDDPGRGAGPGGGQQDIRQVPRGGAQRLAPEAHPPPLSESGDGRQVKLRVCTVSSFMFLHI